MGELVREERPYIVRLQVISTHEFVVDAREAEAAESIAMGYFEDGEDGNVTVEDIVVVDAMPADAAACGEIVTEQ